MKKFNWILILSIVYLFSCTSSTENQGYKVSGTIEGAANQPIYLQEIIYENIQRPTVRVIDTATADAAGSFSFEGSIDEPSISQLQIAGKYYFILMILEKGADIKVSANLNDSGTIEVEGSEASASMNELVKVMQQRNKEMADLRTATNQASISGDMAQVNQARNNYNNALQSYYKEVKEYITNEKSFPAAVFALETLPFAQEFEFVKSFYADNADKEGTKYYTQMKNQIALMEQQVKLEMEKSLIGKVAPEIEQASPDGSLKRLSDLRGNVVLVDFWAAWCGPCRRENPNVVEVYKKYKKDGFTVFSVSLDTDKDKWVEAIRADKLTWDTHVSELKRFDTRPVADYRVTGIPAAFLVDREGMVVAQNLRGKDLEDKVAELVAK